MSLNTPVLLLIFNRLDTSLLVFDQIQNVKPKQLFIAGDGGRTIGEHQQCQEIRSAILEKIDWDCEVITRFQDTNLGCGIHVSGAINWFFEHVEEGIILEDDCLPNKSFFIFCQAMLDRYRNNSDIFSISGSNFQNTNNSNNSYYFSGMSHIWGWATWKRSWVKYQYNTEKINWGVFQNKTQKIFRKKKIVNYLMGLFEEMSQQKIDTWDYQLWFAQILDESLSIIPHKNLVTNIGFNNKATHTKNENYLVSSRPISEIDGEIIHPRQVKRNSIADDYTFFKSGLIFNPELKNPLKLNLKMYFASLINRLKKTLWTLNNYFKLKNSFPISFKNYWLLSKNEKPILKTNNSALQYTSPFWFLHSLHEIFADKIYNFKSNKTNPRIIDCGSNIGLSAIYFKSIYPDCQLTCFEADPTIVGKLEENLKSFKISAEIVDKAVWTEETELCFSSDGQLGGKLSDSGDGKKVQTIRLKDFLFEKIDFLKLDIEGAETAVLKDCKNQLHLVENIFIEYHCTPEEPQELNEMLSILTNAGFRYYIKEAWNNRSFPFMEKNSSSTMYELQLNIFGYRKS
jgi:FkbM family methyltransferase